MSIIMCTFMLMVIAVLQFSGQCNKMFLKLALETQTLVLSDGCFEFRMFFNLRDAAFALPSHAFTYPSDSPCLPMMLLRFMKVSTSSKAWSLANVGPFVVLDDL